jgi:hypothetical protein
LGWKKLLIIFLLSCIGAQACSYVAGHYMVSVGASGGIFGLLGCLLFINGKFAKTLPAGFNLGKRAWIIALGINFSLPFLIPMIDGMAHLGGFIVGLLATWLFLKMIESPQKHLEQQISDWQQTRPIHNACLGVLIVGFVLASIYQGNTNTQLSSEDDINRVYQYASDNGLLSPEDRNNLAWQLVLERDTSLKALDIAKRLLQPVVDEAFTGDSGIQVTDNRHFNDTYAAIEYLQGNHEQAVIYQLKAFAADANNYYASRLSLFLTAINNRQGIWLDGGVIAQNTTLVDN